MRPHLTFGQLTILVGTAVAVAGLLIVIIYAFRKALRSSRTGEVAPPPLRASDSSAFALATMQGVITSLKQEQRKLEETRREVEQETERNARLLEVLAGAMAEALVIFTREGFIRLINPPARATLGADTWSRRRYSEILPPESALAGFLRACMENGEAVKWERVEWPLPDGECRVLLVTILPLQARAGNIEGALCLLREPQGSARSGAEGTV